MTLTEPILSADDISPELLTERLVRNGFLRAGQVERVEKKDAFDSSAAFWHRLKLTFSEDYEGDVPCDIVYKLYREGWFGGGVVEWTFYSELAPQTPGASVCPVYDCAIDHETKHCHFLMPDLSITHAEAPEDWKDRPHELVVEELLKYHVRWWNDSRLGEWPFLARLGGPLRMAQAGLPENVRANCEECVGHLQTFVAKAGDELEHEWVDSMEKVIDRYADVFLARVEGGKHLTLLHGDSHLGNLYYPKDGKRDRLILFDWETYKRGLGAYDLAYMLVHGTAGRRELPADESLFREVDGSWYWRIRSGRFRVRLQTVDRFDDVLRDHLEARFFDAARDGGVCRLGV